jgi:hypothetical protein
VENRKGGSAFNLDRDWVQIILDLHSSNSNSSANNNALEAVRTHTSTIISKPDVAVTDGFYLVDSTATDLAAELEDDEGHILFLIVK